MKLKVKLLTPTAKAPKRATEGSAGYDMYIDNIKDTEISPDRLTVGTGIAVRIPDGYVGKVYVRSSAGKKGIRLSNGTGIIDSDYRGEIILMLEFRERLDLDYSKPIAQLVLTKVATPDVEIVDELPQTERGEGGFGSTNKHIGTTLDSALAEWGVYK